MLEGQNVDEMKPGHEAQTRSKLQQHKVEGTVIGMEPDSVLSNRSDCTWRSETLSAVPDWAFLIMNLYKCGAERYERKVVKLLHCNKFSLEEIKDNLKSVKSCSDLVQ